MSMSFFCWHAHFVVHLQLSFVKLQSMQALGLSIPSVLMHRAYCSHWLQGSACDPGEVFLQGLLKICVSWQISKMFLY